MMKRIPSNLKTPHNVALVALRLNHIRMKSFRRFQYESALFITEKLVALRGWTAKEGLMFVRCLYHLKQYQRAAYIIQQNRLHEINSFNSAFKCRCMLIKCLMKIKKYKEAISCIESSDKMKFDDKWKLTLLVLKSIAQEAMDNREDAKNSLFQALEYNFMCYEAFHNITTHHMASKREEVDLLTQLISKRRTERTKLLRHFMSDFMFFFYYLLLKKYNKPDKLILPEPFEIFSKNNDYLIALAERHFYNFESASALKITTSILERDRYNFKCLEIHASCLLDLEISTDLFKLSQNLIILYPENEVSWYTLGCYYHLIRRKELSRRYLQKAVTLNDVFASAWLLYGHSFSQEGQHDQAMMAYFKAAHLMPGCHLPLLYIGVEYAKTDNHKLGEKFIMKALTIAPEDPLVLHELSVTAFHTDEYEVDFSERLANNINSLRLLKAERHLRHALKVIKYPEIKDQDFQRYPFQYEPIFVNMGHILRKLGRYPDAIEFFNRALSLCPDNASTYTSIGLVYCMMDDFIQAAQFFDHAFSLNRYFRRGDLIKELFEDTLKYYPNSLKWKPNTMPRNLSMALNNVSVLTWTESEMAEKLDSVKKLVAETKTENQSSSKSKSAYTRIG